MIRTPEQYVGSLNDGRVIYFLGEKVPDVTKHLTLKKTVNALAMDWVIANHPQYRDLLTMEDEDGERIMFLWKQPKTAEDLVRRRDIYINCCRIGMGLGSILHAMGVDALAASGVVAKRIDNKMGTKYMDAVEDYRQHLKKTDPAITGAITDVKGNRSLRPSAQEQHKDFYVRVVDRQKDGIVVRGAKMHISGTPAANEIIVSPCRAHREEDKDYAVVFATPLNAKGVKLITTPEETRVTDDEAEAAWEWPIIGRRNRFCECLIAFDDVFVPWNRVFMCGEWQFSRDIAWAFGTFHRLFGIAHNVAELEIKTGAAALVAEYNGIDKYSHIQEKLAWLADHTETCDALSRAACEHPDIDPDTGFAVPGLMYSNIAKFKFANDGAEASKLAADICGGLVGTVPSYRDWMNPEERPIIEKYLAGKAGIPTEHRLRVIRLIKDFTGHNVDQTHIHGEGSLAAQKMALYAGADWARYKAAAKRVTEIPGWEEHPIFKGLPEYPPKGLV